MTDEYILSLLMQTNRIKGIFGDGPHFAISSTSRFDLPSSFRLIRYNAHSAIGHKAAIQVLESVAPGHNRSSLHAEGLTNIASAYFLIDLFPPHVPWTTGMITQLENTPSTTISSMIRGLGFTREEMPLVPTTLHDVLVGLVCFEKLYAPLETIPKFLYLLGIELFKQVLEDNALEFIWWDAEEGISFEGSITETGGLSSFVIESPQGKPLTLVEKVGTIAQLAFASPAQKRAFAALIAKSTTCIREGYDSPICDSVEAFLSLPHVRRMLGFSVFTPPKRVPRWLSHPVLRAARLSRAAETCRMLRAASIKFPFGAKRLADALFATESGEESAANTANYILHGSFKCVVPTSADSYRALIRSILRFRQTAAADRGRKMILQYLARNDAADCVAAIDAALKHGIPTAIMEEARDQFSEFLLPTDRSVNHGPAVWRESIGDPVVNWRVKARTSLLNYCNAQRISVSGACLCGSTISIEACCLAALEGRQEG